MNNLVCDLCGFVVTLKDTNNKGSNFRNGDKCYFNACPGVLTTTPDKAVVVKIKKLHPDAEIPVKMSSGAVGFDLFALEETTCYKSTARMVRTGIAIELPVGYEAQIRPRSSMSLKRQLIISNSPGTIDCDYRGEIIVPMHHMRSGNLWTVKKGERIAQLVVKKVPRVIFEEIDELSETERGHGGFGSTGA